MAARNKLTSSFLLDRGSSLIQQSLSRSRTLPPRILTRALGRVDPTPESPHTHTTLTQPPSSNNARSTASSASALLERHAPCRKNVYLVNPSRNTPTYRLLLSRRKAHVEELCCYTHARASTHLKNETSCVHSFMVECTERLRREEDGGGGGGWRKQTEEEEGEWRRERREEKWEERSNKPELVILSSLLSGSLGYNTGSLLTPPTLPPTPPPQTFVSTPGALPIPVQPSWSRVVQDHRHSSVYFSSSSPHSSSPRSPSPRSPSPSPSPLDRPSPAQMAFVLLKLREELPAFFEGHHSWNMYAPDVVFKYSLGSSSWSIKGSSCYATFLTTCRVSLKMYFSQVQLDLLKITKELEEGTIEARWRLRGRPRAAWCGRERIILEAFSTFSVNSNGAISVHKIDRMMPSKKERNRVMSWLAQVGVALGLTPSQPIIKPQPS